MPVPYCPLSLPTIGESHGMGTGPAGFAGAAGECPAAGAAGLEAPTGGAAGDLGSSGICEGTSLRRCNRFGRTLTSNSLAILCQRFASHRATIKLGALQPDTTRTNPESAAPLPSYVRGWLSGLCRRSTRSLSPTRSFRLKYAPRPLVPWQCFLRCCRKNVASLG